MALDFSKIQTVIDDINSNYTGWKEEPANAHYIKQFEDSLFLETVKLPMISSVITYLYQNHNDKKMLEVSMDVGLLKFYNADSGSNLSIDSACWQREWHAVDYSNKAEVNQRSDEHRGLFNIKVKQQLGVQADYIFKISNNNWGTLSIENSPTDNTPKNLNDYDILIFKYPERSLFDNVASFKTSTSFTGSLLFYDVGVLFDQRTSDIAAEYSSFSDGSGLTLEQIYPDPGVTDSSVLPSHTELNFSGTRGFYIP